ncbi:MAG TPA: lipoyl(octanoyl) transferase LipB [Candidatus Dormibacteraeota bacterium]|jgi:lipoate-protein ligase B|nr:lipoyl(octanoyl) transferase LipB [Candidatus Dormibacteraeota bacterium]
MTAAALPPLRWAWLGTMPYADAWALQRRLAALRREAALDDCVILLEHPPVFTMGRNGKTEHVPGGPERLRALGAEYVEVDRGGSVTFHGPGQLVAYPIVGLAEVFPLSGVPGQGDVLRYLRALEAALCEACAAHGVAAARRPDYTGAWVGTDKVAAIGVKLSGGVTQHGVAVNVSDEPLRWFAEVVPCGIEDGGVTAMHGHGAAADLTPERLAPLLAERLAAAFGRTPLPAGAALDAATRPDREPART